MPVLKSFSDAVVLILSESEFQDFAASYTYLLNRLESITCFFLGSGKDSIFFPLNKYLEFRRVNSSFRYLGYGETKKLLKTAISIKYTTYNN